MGVRRTYRQLKWVAWLAVVGGGVVAIRGAAARRRAAPALGPPATWPPLQVSEEPVAAVGAIFTDSPSVRSDVPDRAHTDGQNDEGSGDRAWVEPTDGSCPVSHPIKANANSGIYHVPGSRFYGRTRAERCYAEASAAEADGYRAAKGS